MSSEHRAAFFAGVKDHSQIKLRAFERYLRPWTAKLGSKQGVGRVWIIDGFAGPGQYESGELGSSGFALRHAQAEQEAGRKYRVACYFAEPNATSRNRLRGLAAKFPDVETQISRHDFWAEVDNVVAMVGADFLFVDPFGLGDLKFAPLVDLCRRLPNVDVIVNFASPAARRLEANHRQLISDAVGGEPWDLPTLTHTFAERLSGGADFLQAAVLPVEAPLGGLKYELVMVARHPSAYELWNDEIATRDSEVLKDDADAGAALVEKCADFLVDRLATRRSFQRDRLISQLSVSDCGEFHRSVYIRAAKALLARGWETGSGPVATALVRRIN